MTKFEVGKTYRTRSPGDYDCIIDLTVASRTAQTLKARMQGEDKTFRISVWQGVEQVMPWGRYSMSPVLGADRLAPQEVAAQ